MTEQRPKHIRAQAKPATLPAAMPAVTEIVQRVARRCGLIVDHVMTGQEQHCHDARRLVGIEARRHGITYQQLAHCLGITEPEAIRLMRPSWK